MRHSLPFLCYRRFSHLTQTITFLWLRFTPCWVCFALPTSWWVNPSMTKNAQAVNAALAQRVWQFTAAVVFLFSCVNRSFFQSKSAYRRVSCAYQCCRGIYKCKANFAAALWLRQQSSSAGCVPKVAVLRVFSKERRESVLWQRALYLQW
jgi:hypothetical protein